MRESASPSVGWTTRPRHIYVEAAKTAGGEKGQEADHQTRTQCEVWSLVIAENAADVANRFTYRENQDSK